MKFILAGIACMFVAVLFAGNWMYTPFAIVSMEPEDYMPMTNFPENDVPNNMYNSSLTYIPSLDMHYIQWNYVWLNVSGHTPDEESVRVYIKDEELHHISLSIHYHWMDVYDYDTVGSHVVINFAPVYHTPSVSTSQVIVSSLQIIASWLIPFIVGMVLITYGISKLKRKKKR